MLSRFFLFKVLQVDLCTFMCHILYRGPATAVPSSVPGSFGKPASGPARSLMVGDVLELVTEDAGGAAGSRALVTVHRVAEHGSMGRSVECTWQRGESESMDVWARGVFCRGESADRGHVHLCTKGHSGCHVGDHDLHCLEWRVVWRGEKHPTWVGFEKEGPTSSVRRARGRAKRTNSSGRPRGSAFVSSDQPSGSRSRRVGRKSSGPPSRRIRYQASKRRRRGSHCVPDPTRSSGERRRSDAPHWEEVHPEPEPKTIELPASRSKKKRLSIATTSCLSGEGVSRHPRGTGVRPVSKAQDAYDSCGEDHAASNAPGGSQVQAKPKAQQEINEETENGIISELDRKWCDFGYGVRGSGSRAKQRRNGSIEAYPGVLLRSFLRTIGSQVVTTGDTQGALGEVRLLELVPDLATKYLDKITTRRSFAVSTGAEMRVLAEVMDSLMAGHVGARATSWPRGSEPSST